MDIDDKTLTLFLMGCMESIFERSIKASDLHMVPGTLQRGLKKDHLKYLEVIAGTLLCSSADILVYASGTQAPIFRMNIVSRFEMEAITEHRLNCLDVMHVLQNARLKGFAQTRANIADKKRYSLFDIPPHSEPTPVERGGLPGYLIYGEDIEDELSFFGGGEEVHFQPHATGKNRVLVFRSQVQGCRLL